MTDDPRKHQVYFQRSVVRFFKRYKPGMPEGLNEEPAYPRMIQCGFYDGIGTLLPLGVYWFERINSQSFQMWSMDSCWDFIPYDRLVNWHSDDELHAYYRALQIDIYSDSARAFLDYVKLRADPAYKPSYELPSYMIDSDGVVIEDSAVPYPMRPRMGGWWEDRDRRDALAESMDEADKWEL